MPEQVLTSKVIKLREAGWSMPKIARYFAVSTVAVYKYLARYAPHLTGRRLMQGVCEICGREGKVHADHDHARGCERGLLCPTCNRALGMFYDDPTRLANAVKYLAKYAVFVPATNASDSEKAKVRRMPRLPKVQGVAGTILVRDLRTNQEYLWVDASPSLTTPTVVND